MAKRKLYKSWEMRHGGNQLAELIEYVSFEFIEKNRKSMDLSERSFKFIKRWVKHRYSMKKAIDELSAEAGHRVSKWYLTMHFRGYQSLFDRLIKHIDFQPNFDEAGNLLPTFSFLEQDEFFIDGGIYRVVETCIKSELFWRSIPMRSEERRFNKIYIYRLYKGRWNRTQTQYAKDYLEAAKLMRGFNSKGLL